MIYSKLVQEVYNVSIKDFHEIQVNKYLKREIRGNNVEYLSWRKLYAMAKAKPWLSKFSSVKAFRRYLRRRGLEDRLKALGVMPNRVQESAAQQPKPPQQLVLPRICSLQQIKLSLEGERLEKANYDILVEENCNCYDADTKALIFCFRKKVVSPKSIALAKSTFGKIDEKMKMSTTRGAAAGKVVQMCNFTNSKRLMGLEQIKGKKGFAYKKFCIDVEKLEAFSSLSTAGKAVDSKIFRVNGNAVEFAWTEEGWKAVGPVTYKLGKTAVSNPVKSYKAGWYYDRFYQVNREWGFTQKFPAEWEKASPFFQEIGSTFKQELPQVYKVHEERMAQHPSTTVAEGVPLSSSSINVNYMSYCHKDRGDLKDGTSVLTVVNGPEGSYKGGYFVLPEYKFAVNVKEGDILFFNGSKVWHGNTPMLSINGGKRISINSYLKKGLIHG